MISPSGFASKVKSSNRIEGYDSYPEMLALTLDRLSRLYLSIQ